MQKNIIISFTLLIIWSCAGSNATSMEYRSATTAIRSERNFAKGEEYALKALDLEIHANEARVAYFLAVEIYRPRKDWQKMNTMLDLAMKRNPGETLERPMRLANGKTLKTISDAVKDLRSAFEKGLLPNSLTDEKYFNIKRMNNIKLE